MRGNLLNRDSPIPLFRQLADLLRRHIAEGKLGPRLPAEPDLAAMYGVSRGTLRRAVALLTEDAVLEISRGRGTFVVFPPPPG